MLGNHQARNKSIIKVTKLLSKVVFQQMVDLSLAHALPLGLASQVNELSLERHKGNISILVKMNIPVKGVGIDVQSHKT